MHFSILVSFQRSEFDLKIKAFRVKTQEWLTTSFVVSNPPFVLICISEAINSCPRIQSQAKSKALLFSSLIFHCFTFLKITCTWCSWLLRNEGKQHAGSTFHDTNGIYVYVNSKDHRALWRPTSRSILIALQYNLSLPCSNSVKVVWLKQRPLDASMTRQVQFSSREELFTLCYK